MSDGDGDDNKFICGICQDEYQKLDTYRFCRCNVYYHLACINKWKRFKHLSKCMVCQNAYIQQNASSNTSTTKTNSNPKKEINKYNNKSKKTASTTVIEMIDINNQNNISGWNKLKQIFKIK